MKLPKGSLWAVTIGAVVLWIAIVLSPVDDLDGVGHGEGSFTTSVPTETAASPPRDGTPPPAPAPLEPSPVAPAPPAPPAPAAVSEGDPEPSGEDGDETPHTFPPPASSGPVDEYKALYERESRDSAAIEFEQEIEAAFRTKNIPPGLLQSVVCRRSVCRVRTRWSQEYAEGFMMALTALLIVDPEGDTAPRFDSILALDPESDPADRSQDVAVYFRRNE